jgi:hypothetical protein
VFHTKEGVFSQLTSLDIGERDTANQKTKKENVRNGKEIAFDELNYFLIQTAPNYSTGPICN